MMMMRRGAEIKGQRAAYKVERKRLEEIMNLCFLISLLAVCGGSEFMYRTSTGASERPPLEATRRQQQKKEENEAIIVH